MMKYVSVGVIVLLLLSVVLLNCSGRNIIKDEYQYVADHIEENPLLTHHHLRVGDDTLHYVTHGDESKPALVIIHGTPGSWRQYSRYLLNEEMLKHFFMVVIDRPGWGSSTLGGDRDIATFAEQADIIAGLATVLREKNGQQAVILMGHSLGASIAPRVAMDYPQLIDGLLLFAGTIDPELSSPRWFNYLGNLPLAHYLIGKKFSRSNKEIFALKENIVAMKERWYDIEAHVIAIQGSQDVLVSPANSGYIEKSFNPDKTTVIHLKKTGHLFPMTRRQDVANWAKQLLSTIRS